jgi:hypothetical protein
MNKKIEVSELFLSIFKLFNVSDQRLYMKQLEKKELYLLLISVMDLHNEDDHPIVILNFSDFEFEINEILELHESEKTTNQYLLDLIKETGDSILEFLNYSLDLDLPTPYTREEVRDLKLGGILD